MSIESFIPELFMGRIVLALASTAFFRKKLSFRRRNSCALLGEARMSPQNSGLAAKNREFHMLAPVHP